MKSIAQRYLQESTTVDLVLDSRGFNRRAQTDIGRGR